METLAIKALTGGGGSGGNLIDDTTTSTTKTWSSSKLNEDIATKIESPGHPSDNKFYAMKNDEWTEFSGGGASIDDTTTALDKTWSSSKINTELGVYKAILTISCVDDDGNQISGNTISVKGVKSNHPYYSGTYSGTPLQIAIMNETEIKIQFSSFGQYIVPNTMKFTIGGNTTKTCVYKDEVVYGFHINSTESNPSDAVTYLSSAIGMTPAHMDYMNDEFDYGSWENAFFMPRPCMLKYDGTVDYYLNPNDYSQKENGTASDISNTDYNGNAMMEWGQGSKIWYKVVPDADDVYSGSVYIASSQVDSDYKSWSFVDSHNNSIDHFYTPIYNGSLVSSKMRSLSGQTCMYNQNATSEVNYAKANNINASEIEWYTEVFADVQLINFLLILMGKSLQTQTVFGNGHYTGGSSASNLLTTGTMNNKGMFWGSNSTGYGVKVFGMENWWGNQWRRYAGHLYVNNKHKYKMTYNNADGSLATSYNMDGTNYLEDATGIAGSSGGYINKEKFIAGLGMIPTSASGTSETYYSDGCYFANGTMYVVRGGACNIGFIVGTIASSLNYAASSSGWNIGSAPSCKPLAR